MPGVLPPQACGVIVPAAETRVPTCFIGLAVHGERRALEAFLMAASLKSVRGKILEGGEPLEAMVSFAGADKSAAFSLLQDSVGGRYGLLKVEVVVAPVSAAADGLDMDNEIVVTQPSFLTGAPK